MKPSTKPSLFAFVLSFLVLTSCNFRKSAKVDFLTGISTRGNGLSCDEVYLSDGEKELNRNSFIYGESFYLNFEDISGFSLQNEHAFPGMRLSVTGQNEDTVLKKDDLYADQTDGFNYSPLLLKAFLTVADPIHSRKEYTLEVLVWDKKGKGTYRANMNFKVIPDPKIIVESKNVSWDEIYLFSGGSKKTLTGDHAKIGDDVYLLFEGLRGFSPMNGTVNFALSMKITDGEGTVLLDEEDLAGEEGMNESDFMSQVAPNFVVSNPDVVNPVTCEVHIRDQKSESRIKVTVKINME